ncbi:MAG: DNA polymerase III subunit beta [Blastocatellia bacterium]|nr:DNA polymerase III subunit beta [Blastocatellia bacterium]MCS7158101.1 DNA polymerase III subunit beta [Blastocatellia bacterium]MCX7753036.1 DNA polymerase III subunit beta [Blastocatellia bacterium]MDW8168559.1 DNA polymerase III subunit beta [Acidobacteriota bacterium]MDW8257278.1 DNA polymerase III subunit beta [Acidobacteriota bacterium]
MHIQLVKSAFQRELGLVQTVVERRHTIPILAYVRLETREGKVRLTGTDLDVSMQLECEAEVGEDGVVCLPARKLFDIVRALPEEPIELSGTEERVTLTCGRARFRLSGLAAENFPDVPTFPKEGRALSAGKWIQGIERVIFATTMEEMRYALSGVQTEWWDGGVRLVATDGHRLALWETAEPPMSRNTCLIPKKTMRELSRLIEHAEEEASVEFAADTNHVYFRVAGRELVSRLLTGQFPNYELVIPKEAAARAVVSAESLREACRRVAILADERSRGVRLSFSQGRLVLTARSASEDEEATEELLCAYDGEPIDVAFNVEYLLDFLSVVSGEVEIALRDGQSPARLCPLGEEGRYLYVVMPMRLL